jgi:hypothetical protein
MPKNSEIEVLPSCFWLEAELHRFRHNSRYAYAMVVNFGEHDLQNIPRNFGIQHKAKF